MSTDPRMYAYYRCKNFPECRITWRIYDPYAYDPHDSHPYYDDSGYCENCGLEAELDAQEENEMDEAMERTEEPK